MNFHFNVSYYGISNASTADEKSGDFAVKMANTPLFTDEPLGRRAKTLALRNLGTDHPSGTFIWFIVKRRFLINFSVKLVKRVVL